MPLEEYRRKRDFAATPEPAPGDLVERSGRFTIQRHRATALHHDFRLEIGGVLVSWAVPKGLTLDAAARRLAMRTEDHPIEYLDFEGVIPSKQYGAGDVIVWDWGYFEPEAETPDPAKALRAGEIKFVLHGEKVRGRFTIIRTSGRRGRDDDREQWLIIHKRDVASVDGWDAEDHPISVKTGRTNDEVRDGVPPRFQAPPPRPVGEIDLTDARDEPMPDFIPPMRATLADSAFDDPDWLFEIKWDGYRVEAVIRDGRAKLWTRNQQDAARYFPELAGPAEWLEARDAIVDGEVVALDEAGRPSFSLLQDRTGIRTGRAPGTARHGPPAPALYQVFDLLHIDGRSLLVRAARRAQAPAPLAPPSERPRPVRRPRGGRRPRVHRGRACPGAGGHRRQAAPLAVRARPAVEELAQDQAAPRAGGRGRRLARGAGHAPRSRVAHRGRSERRPMGPRRPGRQRDRHPDPPRAAREARRAGA